MNAFIGLVKKDMLISRFWYSTWLIFLSLLMVAGSVFASKLNEPDLVLPILVTLMPLHVFFMPIMMYSLLRMEGKTQLWLYSPQSSVKLLLAKCKAALIFQIISQVLVMSYGVSMLKWFVNQNATETISIKALLLTNGGILAGGFYFMIWIIFLWTVYHSLGRYPALKRFRWLVVILVLFTCNLIETLFIKLKLIQNHLFNWTTTVDTALYVGYEKTTGWTMVYEKVPVPIIPVIIYSFLALIIFLIRQ